MYPGASSRAQISPEIEIPMSQLALSYYTPAVSAFDSLLLTPISVRTLCGVLPVHEWNARAKELESSNPSRKEISALDIVVLPR